MSYQGPISMYTERIIKDIVEKQDGYLVEEVRRVGFDINKEELAKALKYDRDQYDKGYHDGRMYQPPVKTNYDLLIRKTPEEMAEFISGKARTFGEEYEGYMSALDWLKQEAKE